MIIQKLNRIDGFFTENMLQNKFMILILQNPRSQRMCSKTYWLLGREKRIHIFFQFLPFFLFGVVNRNLWQETPCRFDTLIRLGNIESKFETAHIWKCTVRRPRERWLDAAWCTEHFRLKWSKNSRNLNWDWYWAFFSTSHYNEILRQSPSFIVIIFPALEKYFGLIIYDAKISRIGIKRPVIFCHFYWQENISKYFRNVLSKIFTFDFHSTFLGIVLEFIRMHSNATLFGTFMLSFRHLSCRFFNRDKF